MDATVSDLRLRPPKPRLWRRRVIVIASVTAVLAAVIGLTFRPKPVGADFAAISRGDLLVMIEDEGETRIHDVYVVSAPVAGRVERIELDVGDEVIAGETVLALFQPSDPAIYDIRARSEAEAGVTTSLAELARANAERQFAKAELERSEKLRKQGTIAQVTLDRALLAMRTAEAAVEQSAAMVAKRKADLQTARIAGGRESGPADKISYVPVRAPVNGRVLKRIQQSETILAAGTPILEIGDPAKLEIVTDLLSSDAVRVHEGDRVVIEEWGGSKPLEGKVRRIEPFGFTKISALGIEEQRVNVIMDFVSPPGEWRALGHGYRVITKIVVSDRRDVLKVPLSALFRSGADWSVFVNAGDRARLRKVSIGERNNLEAEITSGLNERDQVILHPSDQIRDGTRVASRD